MAGARVEKIFADNLSFVDSLIVTIRQKLIQDVPIGFQTIGPRIVLPEHLTFFVNIAVFPG